MKLNKKGYLLVEIIVASVIAMSIMYFLMEITIKIKNINEDYYVETKLDTDQVLMIRNVMEDLNNNQLIAIDTSNNSVTFTFNDASGIEFNTKITLDETTRQYKYGKLDSEGNYDNEVYVKKIDERLNLGAPSIIKTCINGVSETCTKGILKIDIPATTIYSDNDYGVKLVIPYDGKICVNPIIPKDETEANSPDLVDGMIPVVFNECSKIWQKADMTNGWYNYDLKKWANAVLVSSTNRNTYKDAPVGTKIADSDILAHYVWIPRYKYRVWNINKVIGIDSVDDYNPRTSGIDIVFEKETDVTGEIKCNSYSFDLPSIEANSPNEICSGSNGEYYTHPAFWWDTNSDNVREESEEIRGLWIGKFEISKNTSDQLVTKPNVHSLTNDGYLGYMYTDIKNMQKESNGYGLPTDVKKADSHMIKNMEWGAVAYFTHSKYGRCSDSGCTELSVNDYSGPYTGGNNYIINVEQTTTGNVYGVYDMSGGAWEYVMGNMSDYSSEDSFEYIFNIQGAVGFLETNIPLIKYIDTYAYGGTTTDQRAYNRSRLGDATGEIVLESTDTGGGWNGDYAEFVVNQSPWFMRGGTRGRNYNDFNKNTSGIFSFHNSAGYRDAYYSTRASLVAPNYDI